MSPNRNSFLSSADVNIDLYQKVKVIKKRGDDYLQPVDTKTTVDIGDAKAHLSGLFDGNELLGKYRLAQNPDDTHCLLPTYTFFH